MAQINSFINLTSTGTILPTGGGVLSGMYVHSTSSGVFKLWHGTTTADIGFPLGGNLTPAVGYHNLGNLNTTAGVNLQPISGSFNVTFHIKYSD